MLFYLPLERYKERYTWFMSGRDGWAETHFNNNGLTYVTYEGDSLSDTIDTGVVLDAYGRSHYAMTQLCKLIPIIRRGGVNGNDVIYTEDFWHPGIESLFYIRNLSGIDFKIGTFLHAQTVDEHDFTHSMQKWMRPIEEGFGRSYDYIFVTSEILKGLCIEAGIGSEDNIHTVGLPYNSKRLIEQLHTIGWEEQSKEPYVIFSSRFDSEKNPHFFLDLVEACPDIQFKLVQPRKSITNDIGTQERLDSTLNKCDNLEVVDTSNKRDYYTLLSGAQVQFNCAYQDWVSWTLLEAATFKCNPLYPNWRDFPLELAHQNQYLYDHGDLDGCKEKLYKLMEQPFNEGELGHIVEKHDNSWNKYLRIMGLI